MRQKLMRKSGAKLTVAQRRGPSVQATPELGSVARLGRAPIGSVAFLAVTGVAESPTEAARLPVCAPVSQALVQMAAWFRSRLSGQAAP